MKVTFTSGVIDKGTLYEAGQTYELTDADAKRIQENTRQDIFVTASADAQVHKTAEPEAQPAPKAPAAPQPATPPAPKVEGQA